MKPILIDGLYLNCGGALTVLNRLLDGLAAEKVDYVLIKDARCPQLTSENAAREIVIMPPSFKMRWQYYRHHKNDFQTILCMGNVPPPCKMNAKVHTYFHNLSLLVSNKGMNAQRKLKNELKRLTISVLARYTDSWIVQTSHTLNCLKSSLPTKGKSLYVMPIYSLPEGLEAPSDLPREDYLFIGNYTHAKGHDELLAAWKLLHQRGFTKPLHLTVTGSDAFLAALDEAQKQGVPVVNHGFLPREEVVKLYHSSKAIVYPSYNESLGLGIIEGLHAGCDVIASDLPFAHAVCQPSEVFDPSSAESIAGAVERYEEGGRKKSTLKIKDSIEDLMSLIINHLPPQKSLCGTTRR